MRRLGSLLLALALLVTAHLWVPLPVAACSCVAPMDVLEGAGRDPGASVFTAQAGPRVGNSIPFGITRWFKGIPPIGPAVLEGSPPDDMCGNTTPPAGGEYLFVTYTSETSNLAISGCSVQADLATPDGRAMLARARAIYGGGAAPPTTAAAPTAASTAMPTTDPAALVVPIAVGSALLLGIVLGLATIIRRRQTP